MKPPPWPKCSRLPTAPTNPSFLSPDQPPLHPPCFVHKKNVNFESMTSLKNKHITTITTTLSHLKHNPPIDNLHDIIRSNIFQCTAIRTSTTFPTSTPPTLSIKGSAYTESDSSPC